MSNTPEIPVIHSFELGSTPGTIIIKNKNDPYKAVLITASNKKSVSLVLPTRS